ncbi:Ubiquitin carboxyl-terminal hydrolase 27 [Abeliophyllum distichum]|uniref:Ubiquitin carboxyl-terminal hydrolase n=1 Tax=Abeliophyllum distichum TaxID=126358 RepID=A0ABD1SE74_9LAMI
MSIQESIKVSSFIPKLNYVSKFLPQGKWGSASGVKISVAVGVLGAAGIILAVKDKVLNFNILLLLSDNECNSEKYWTIPGLQNFGNNCFLNVILQDFSTANFLLELYFHGFFSIIPPVYDVINLVFNLHFNGFIFGFRLWQAARSFRKYLEKTAEEFKFLSDGVESMPLINALASLMEELGTVRHGRTVLSPRKLMLAMDNYVPSFNLTSQQDAEEAFSHILSSLREEVSEHFVPDHSNLADLTALPHRRILVANSSNGRGEWQRWRHSFLGPFDGILGSILICQSCSFQVSLDFQLFHSLHLSPPISHNATMMAGCSLEDCLEQFFVAEHIENYCCSHCWHSAAIKYVSAVAEDKTDIGKLQSCTNDDSCDCKTLSSLQGFPWSNRFCRTFKQLSIARSPKILCIHLQRASANIFGQTVKLRGIKNLEENLQFKQSKKQCGNFSSKTEVAGESERNTVTLPNGNCLKVSKAGPMLLKNSGCTDTSFGSTPMLSNNKVGSTIPSKPRLYRLVSVVEHFGTVGSGHYMVYRRVTAKIGAEDPVALLESAIDQWFCISDSEVQSVSEKDVLNANASVLFYEKIVVH